MGTEAHRGSAGCAAGDGSHAAGSPEEEEGAAATLLLHRLAQGREENLCLATEEGETRGMLYISTFSRSECF